MRTAGVAVLAGAAEIIKSCLFLGGRGVGGWRVGAVKAEDTVECQMHSGSCYHMGALGCVMGTPIGLPVVM